MILFCLSLCFEHDCQLLCWCHCCSAGVGTEEKRRGCEAAERKGNWGRKRRPLKTSETAEILQPNGSVPDFSFGHPYSPSKGRAGQPMTSDGVHGLRSNLWIDYLFSGTFSWHSEGMSNDSSDALLHSKPILFEGREAYISLSEKQNQIGLSSGSCWHLYGNPPGDAERGSLPPAPSQGSAGTTEGLQPTACLICRPKEGLSQMPFPSVQGHICQSP